VQSILCICPIYCITCLAFQLSLLVNGDFFGVIVNPIMDSIGQVGRCLWFQEKGKTLHKNILHGESSP